MLLQGFLQILVLLLKTSDTRICCIQLFSQSPVWWREEKKKDKLFANSPGKVTKHRIYYKFVLLPIENSFKFDQWTNQGSRKEIQNRTRFSAFKGSAGKKASKTTNETDQKIFGNLPHDWLINRTSKIRGLLAYIRLTRIVKRKNTLKHLKHFAQSVRLEVSRKTAKKWYVLCWNDTNLRRLVFRCLLDLT